MAARMIFSYVNALRINKSDFLSQGKVNAVTLRPSRDAAEGQPGQLEVPELI